MINLVVVEGVSLLPPCGRRLLQHCTGDYFVVFMSIIKFLAFKDDRASLKRQYYNKHDGLKRFLHLGFMTDKLFFLGKKDTV